MINMPHERCYWYELEYRNGRYVYNVKVQGLRGEELILRTLEPGDLFYRYGDDGALELAREEAVSAAKWYTDGTVLLCKILPAWAKLGADADFSDRACYVVCHGNDAERLAFHFNGRIVHRARGKHE